MKLEEALASLPETDKVVIVLSGGMDSTIAMRLAVERYGAENVYAVSFDYGQRQRAELRAAKRSTQKLGVTRRVFDLSVLGKIGQGFSANVDKTMKMPTIQDILGDPSPDTEVPNRNMILLSVVAAYAQVNKIEYIITGLQVHDEYSYWDTTQRFVDKVNDVLSENRIIKVKIIAPFSKLSKKQELLILKELDGNLDLTKHTLTCYNPLYFKSCGICPSCSERIQNFMAIGEKDPIPYAISINWNINNESA